MLCAIIDTGSDENRVEFCCDRQRVEPTLLVFSATTGSGVLMVYLRVMARTELSPVGLS